MDNSLLKYDSLEQLTADEIYSYMLIDGSRFCNTDLHSISLKSCLVENCIFSGAILANSDMDSSQFNNCSFENHSFQNADIVSCNFEHCIFKNINFKGSTITNDTFKECVFISCDLNHIVMSDSIFINCSIENMNMRQSSTSLNHFTQCTFKDSKINGNFLFNLLMNCQYQCTTIDISLISSNFGIFEDGLQQLGFSKSALHKYQQELMQKNDIFGVAIIELNTNDFSYDYSMLACIQVIIKKINSNIIIRTEELRFIELILDYFIAKEYLAPITIIQLLGLVENILNCTTNNTAKQKSSSCINYIYNVLFSAYRQYISTLHISLADIKPRNLPVTVKFTFNEEPNIEICLLLTEIQKQLNIKGSQPIRIKTENGSFIDWIKAPDTILKCIQLIISILGLGIKLKSPSQKEEKPSTPTDNEVYNNSNKYIGNTVVLQIPESIRNQIDQIQTETDVSKAINVFVINGMTINNNYQGVNRYNIKNIECFYE